MFELSSISAITIPVGDVQRNVLSIYQVTESGDVLLWSKRLPPPPPTDEISVIYYDSPSATITYHDEAEASV